jgi:hypothetical protein
MVTIPPRLYLAYGSNLCLEQIRARCTSSQPVAAVRIQGWRLGFYGQQSRNWGIGGVATLIPDTTASTHGALYVLSEADEAKMDVFEGIPFAYAKVEDFTAHVSGFEQLNGQQVYTYIKVDTSQANSPSEKYIDTIRQGYRDWRLPLNHLAGW